MSLVPVIDSKLPGLWRSPDWKLGAPGVYALIIGVSSYPHLAGGAEPASENYGLGQLKVSASTALAVFEWLRSEFVRKDLEPVWCQVLLSPTTEEAAALQKQGFSHFGPPTYDTIRAAMKRWTSVLPPDAEKAGRSRTFFFFSGHGIQSNWHSLLLPSDYLDPSFPSPQLQDCISTREIKAWMETHGVGEHIAVFDACRNEFEPLSTKGAAANPILEAVSTAGRPPRVVATLSATAPKRTAYQSSAAAEPLSFFGKALLEGLRGGFGQALSGPPGELHVEFNKLAGYVLPRVNELLKAYNEQLEQPGRACLDSAQGEAIVADVVSVQKSNVLPKQASIAEAQRVLDERFTHAKADRVPLSGLRHFSIAHSRFGHEDLSELWSERVFRLHDLAPGSAHPDHEAAVLRTERAESKEGHTTTVRVDLELPPHHGGLLAVFEDPHAVARGRLAIPLPTDPMGPVPIRLTLTVGRRDEELGPRALQGVEARLGPSTGSRHYAYLWELNQRAAFGSFADAARRADPAALQDAVYDKRTATTAAIAGAILLARGGRISKARDWTRNLMDGFEEIPDGAVLWAESLRAALEAGEKEPFGAREPLDEMARALSSLERRGVPLFAETLEMTDELLRYLALRRDRLTRPWPGSLDRVRGKLDRVLQIAAPGGHFLAFAGRARPEVTEGADQAGSVEDLLRFLRPARSTH